MKTSPGKLAAVVFCLITLFCLPLNNNARGGTARSVTEQVALPTEPGGGIGGYFPPGTGVFGKTRFQLTGSGGCYSYDPELYPVPPSSISNMGPGHCGSNEHIYLLGSVTISGHVNVPQAIVDEVTGGDFTHLEADYSCEVGSKLPVGTTGEEGDEREFLGPRDSLSLGGWKPDQSPADGTYKSGTPCWPYDPGYAAYPTVTPQWDKDDDGDTDTDDYYYFVDHGGFAAENGGSTDAIPYTEKDDLTIMVMDKGVLVPASEGTAWYDDYEIDDTHNFKGTWKEVYFTGTQYRFNNFKSGPSEPYYFTGDMEFYCEDLTFSGSCDMILQDNDGNSGSVVMAVKNDIEFSGEADFNVGGGSRPVRCGLYRYHNRYRRFRRWNGRSLLCPQRGYGDRRGRLDLRRDNRQQRHDRRKPENLLPHQLSGPEWRSRGWRGRREHSDQSPLPGRLERDHRIQLI